MKVTISIDEQSLGNELKCASDFLLAVANERNQANGLPTFGKIYKGGKPEVQEAKAVIMKSEESPAVIMESKKAPAEVVEEIPHEELADKAVEATQVKEESEGDVYTFDSVVAMSEEEMKNVPTQVLYDILTGHFNVDPAEHPGKNTNTKLRGLLLSAINAEAKEEETVTEEEETVTEEENAPQTQAIEPQEAEEVPEEAAPAEDFPEVTIEMLREKATELIRLKKRQVVADAFAECGATNFGTLQSERYNDFYALICQA
jgi:hypothetical protein|nr:MAG TPA: hypothetical protein [Caudoviricetes sp.]